MFGKFIKTIKKIKHPVKEMFRDESGVSVIFGALLLLAILTLFLSAFLLTALPAKVMSEESADNDLILSGILKLSEKTAASSSHSFYSKHSAIQAVESEGGILFAVASGLSAPPETESFLKSDSFNHDLFFGFNDDLADDFVFYRLSSGSLIFSSRYSQIPDRVYSLGDSSLLLIQEGGSSFLKPPAVFVRKNDGKILISMSGDIIRSASSPVFGDLTTLNYRVIQKAEVYDFATAVCIFYIPPGQDSFFNETVAVQREKAFKQWILEFENNLNRNFPELKTKSDADNLMIVISSDSAFEIDITVREIEYVIL
ncbi:MAG: hypothetical protein LBE57_06635 [Methanosarcinales archaeon]|jgi:hypothetical protein|nr:hypothetical protein [Methanosarcinales archaeon]